MRIRNLGMRIVLPVATLLAAPVVNLLGIPNPALIFMLLVVYFSFSGGVVSGGVSALLTIAYSAWFFSEAGSFVHYSSENLKKFLLIAATMPIAVLLVGRLKDKLQEKTVQLERKMSDYSEQLRLACNVQRDIQAGDYADEQVVVRTIYQPAQMVSGDSYYYRWRPDCSVFNGFVLDVTGHGIPTALQTAGIRVLMEQELESAQCSAEFLELMNKRIEPYLSETSFAAVILFSFDFRTHRLSCISGGINYFLASQSSGVNWKTIPGSYLGISPEAEFGVAHIPFASGDSFCFVTDGIVDQMDMTTPPQPVDYDELVEQLAVVAKRKDRRDDCSALCIKIK